MSLTRMIQYIISLLYTMESVLSSARKRSATLIPTQQRLLDRVAIAASALCLIHCLALSEAFHLGALAASAEGVETGLTVIGVLLLAVWHVLNRRAIG